MQLEVQLRQAAPCLESRGEIDSFFLALESYPASAARHPRLTFQKHITAICLQQDIAPLSRPRRRSKS